MRLRHVLPGLGLVVGLLAVFVTVTVHPATARPDAMASPAIVTVHVPPACGITPRLHGHEMQLECLLQ